MEMVPVDALRAAASLVPSAQGTMAIHRIRRGFTVPIAGAPEQRIRRTAPTRHVALLADDYPGLRPRVRVEHGQAVRRGDCLFEDRGSGVRFAAPGNGRVAAIHRGSKRSLQSVVIELDDGECVDDLSAVDQPPFSSFRGQSGPGSREHIVELLCESGLWSGLRTRPFSRVPKPSDLPHAVFVTAIDSEPLAVDPRVVINEHSEDFRRGLLVVSRLTEGKTYLCVAPDTDVAAIDAPIQTEVFSGPHPAGLAGLHIHMLEPVSRNRTAWTIGYQDVIAIGRLFTDGRLHPQRVISIAGPPVTEPRVVRTRAGAHFADLTSDDSFAGEVRLVSGSALSGKAAQTAPFAYLGRYHNQLTVLAEDRKRELLGWLAPGLHKFSILPVFLGRMLGARVDMTTSTHGASRAMVPIGLYERVMPLDILPTILLRALLVGDLDRAEELGCLELDEEDLALCSFVCPSKIDYGRFLRKSLDRLADEQL